MIIYFGLQFDERVYRQKQEAEGGVHCLGPVNLLYMLESHMGLIGHPANNEHLRIEQYRQYLLKHLETEPLSFYAASFESDPLGTATRLLELRDELYLAGFDFLPEKKCPGRLETICRLEASVKKNGLSAGYPERFQAVLRYLEQREIPVKQIILNEPLALLPAHFQNLIGRLKRLGVKIEERNDVLDSNNSDLAVFQNYLIRNLKNQKLQLNGDGSLLIIKAARETEAATFLAKMLGKNPALKPLCLIPEKNRALDNALIQEGLPSLGILSASLARPSLQILKLVTAFLWQPVDPYKIMEFVSLSVKPLADDLAEKIAKLMAEKPGINSDSWHFMIRTYFEELKEAAKNDPTTDPVQIEKQYKFWFERKRFDIGNTVPISDVIEIFEYLSKWAYAVYEQGKLNSMQVLSGQAGRIVELLEIQQTEKKQLNHLELERIIRTIYEPSPVRFSEAEKEHLPFVYHSSTVIDPVDALIWWNFVQNEPVHFFSPWYQNELRYLERQALKLQKPKDKNALLLWQRPRVVFKTQMQLILVIPEKVNGSTVYAHPLYDELEAVFKNPEAITLRVNDTSVYTEFAEMIELPWPAVLPSRSLGKPVPFIELDPKAKLDQNEYETFSSLNALFYFPYQWVFRHQIKLHKSSIMSIVKEATLMGNLAHRFFEMIFKQEIGLWTKADVESWIDKNAYNLLAKEGAVLLLYGREPEKIAFIKKIKYAAWSLISLIQNNGWEVVNTEMDLDGAFMNTRIRGKADLVLQRGQEFLLIDLKWRGATYRENMIRNEEDLQLVTYSKLLAEDAHWAHTAYFIIENGKMIARNNLAFKEVIGVSPGNDHLEVNKNIWRKMSLTYEWRIQQLAEGRIEVRTEQTAKELEDFYRDELLDILEMKDKDALFDDYRTLINLVE